MADPVSQIFAQAQAGSAQGQGFGQFAAQGMQQGLARRRLDLEERQMEREEERQSLLMPLQEEALRLRNTATGLDIAQAQSNARYALDTKQADLAVSNLMGELAQTGSWGSPESWQAWNRITSSVPLASVTKSGQLFIQQQRLAMENQRLSSQFGRPTEVTIPTPVGGTAQFGTDRALTSQPGTLSTLGREVADLSTLEATNPAAAARFREAQAQRDASRNVETSVTVGPGGETTTTFKRGGSASASPGGLTPTQSGTMKMQVDKLTDTATRVGELATIADQVYGPVAATKTVIVDRLLSNFNPSLAEGQRIEGRTKAGLVQEGIIRSLGEGQGQLSNKDVARFKQVLAELGDAGELAESPARARQILFTLQKEMARDAYEKARTMGAAPSPTVLNMMDPFVLAREFKEKRISADQLREAINNNVHQRDVDRFLEAR